MFESFRVAGFEEIRSNLDKWDVLPIQFQRLHKTFLSVSSEDLLIKGANITLIASKELLGCQSWANGIDR